jgi:hypothetical protein
MADRTDPTAVSGDTAVLSRYADRDRPPARWLYPVAGVVLGGAVALIGVLPAPWGAALVALAAAAGLGVDVWLSRRHGIPQLRQLPASVRREQIGLIVATGVAALAMPLLAGFLDGLTVPAAFLLAGVVLALGLGVWGPIVDRRARRRARELLR